MTRVGSQDLYRVAKWLEEHEEAAARQGVAPEALDRVLVEINPLYGDVELIVHSPEVGTTFQVLEEGRAPKSWFLSRIEEEPPAG